VIGENSDTSAINVKANKLIQREHN